MLAGLNVFNMLAPQCTIDSLFLHTALFSHVLAGLFKRLDLYTPSVSTQAEGLFPVYKYMSTDIVCCSSNNMQACTIAKQILKGRFSNLLIDLS